MAVFLPLSTIAGVAIAVYVLRLRTKLRKSQIPLWSLSASEITEENTLRDVSSLATELKRASVISLLNTACYFFFLEYTVSDWNVFCFRLTTLNLR